MESRVAHLERTGPPQGIHIDMEQLRAEQRQRAGWLDRAKARRPRTDWAAVRSGARILLSR